MKNFTLLLICIFSSLGTNLLACSCLNSLTFCEAAQSNSKIAEVEIIDKYDGSDLTTYMDIKIIESLQGTIDEEQLTVISYGTSCDVFFDGFTIGEKLVLRFKDIDPADGGANFSNFSFFACSTNYLRLSNNELTGNIEPNVSVKNYDDFKASIGACSDLSLFDRTPENLGKHVFITSNPTPDITYIHTYNLDPTRLSFELYSTNGQLITSINSNSISPFSTPLDLSGMAVGVYFLRIRYKDLSTIKKVVKF